MRALIRDVRSLDESLSPAFLRSLSDLDAERILLRFPGLSWEGSRCVLLDSLRCDVFPVDSSTFRILKRVDVIQRGIIYRRREVHDTLQHAVSTYRRRDLHVNFVIHCPGTCTPLRPQCPERPLRDPCPGAGVTDINRRLTAAHPSRRVPVHR